MMKTLLWTALLLLSLPFQASAQTPVSPSSGGVDLPAGGFNLISPDVEHEYRVTSKGRIVGTMKFRGVALEEVRQEFSADQIDVELKSSIFGSPGKISIVREAGAPEKVVLDLVALGLKLEVPKIEISAPQADAAAPGPLAPEAKETSEEVKSEGEKAKPVAPSK